MEEHDIIAYIIFGIIAFSIVLYANERFIGTKLPQNIQENLSQPLVLAFAGVSNSPIQADVTPRSRVGDYLYEIRTAPRITVTGKRTAPVNIIAIISFKGQSIRATFSSPTGDSDSFTIGVEDEIIEPNIKADIISEIMPIQTYDNAFYSDRFSYRMPVLVRSGRSAIIAAVNVDDYFNADYAVDFNPVNQYDCKATFTLRGPCITKTSSRLNGTPGSTESEWKQIIDMCGGTATIMLNAEPDCSANAVNAEIDYGCSTLGGSFCGEPWENVGETVLLSFGKDNECPRQSSDFNVLLGLCREDRLGGKFELNAGCIDRPDKNCFA